MKQLFKALDCGATAFFNELWLPTLGYRIFDDSSAASAGAEAKSLPESSPATPGGQPTAHDLNLAVSVMREWLQSLGFENPADLPKPYQQTITRLAAAAKENERR